MAKSDSRYDDGMMTTATTHSNEINALNIGFSPRRDIDAGLNDFNLRQSVT